MVLVLRLFPILSNLKSTKLRYAAEAAAIDEATPLHPAYYFMRYFNFQEAESLVLAAAEAWLYQALRNLMLSIHATLISLLLSSLVFLLVCLVKQQQNKKVIC